MAELLSLADTSVVSPSMDPIYTSQSAPLALAAEGIRAILRRTKSGGYQSGSQDPQRSVTPDESEDENEYQGEDEDEGDDEYARVRANSPVRANSKRRRSAPPTSCPGIRHRSLRARSPPVYSETGFSDRDALSHSVFYPSIRHRLASGQRSPSRGRTWRRDDTPHSGDFGRGRNRQHGERSNVSRRRGYTQSERTPEQASHLPSSSEADDSIVNTSSYTTKGAFRLNNYRPSGEFRFPKPGIQPEPIWRAGDAFSGDEARPKFVFPTTRRRKRKRSRSLSAFAQLSLEAENIVEVNGERATSGQLYQRGSHRLRVQSSAMTKDLWPTRENFMEDSIVKQPGKVTIENHNITKSTPQMDPRCPPMPKTTQTAPRKRQGSDFENFGRQKRKSRSRHGNGPSLSFAGVPQVNGFRASDDGHEEERNGRYEGGRYECMKQSVANEEPNYIFATAHDVEASDSGSKNLGEEDVEDSIPDSQPNEVPLSSFKTGETPASIHDLAITADGAFNLV